MKDYNLIKEFHFSIKQSFKMFCFGANYTLHLYHKTHYLRSSQLKVTFLNLSLLVPLPIGPWSPV